MNNNKRTLGMSDKARRYNIKGRTIIGAIAGDIIGSYYEYAGIKTTNFTLFRPESTFTDDTVLTIAIADAILDKKDFKSSVLNYANEYPAEDYGGLFKGWMRSDNPQPYNSFGNGSGMRVSSIGFAYDTLDEVLKKAKESAEFTHNHPEGIKGAQAIASSIFLARTGASKEKIKEYVIKTFNYNLNFTLNEIRPTYRYDVTSQGSVPQSIVAFLESTDYESAIRLAISLGGDCDTIACMTGGIASAYYKDIPEEIIEFAIRLLPHHFIKIINAFDKKFS